MSPVRVIKRSGVRPWKIIERDGTIVGSSTTKEKAESSCRARNASRHGWRPTRR